MKQFFKRFTAAALALSLTLGPSALASEALGWDLHTAVRALSQGAELTTGWFWSDTYSDLRTERYVTYTPNAAVQPSVTYGDTVLKKSTLSTLARKLENSGKRVVGGTNGDFYVVSTGQPLGLVVTDGIIRSSSSYHYAVGFRADGTAFIGQPGLQISATMPDRPTALAAQAEAQAKAEAEAQAKAEAAAAAQSSLPPQEGEAAAAQPSQDVQLPPGEEPAALPSPAPEPQTSLPPIPLEVHDTSVWVTGGINKVRAVQSADGGGLTLLTGDFSATTENTAAGVDVILYPTGENEGETVEPGQTGLGQALTYSSQPRIGSRIRCTVGYVTDAAKANPIPAGALVLTMNGKDNAATLALLRSLQPGDRVDIDIAAADPVWNEVKEALGGMYRLLQNGQVGSGLSSERTARTAIGVKADGTVLFYTLDGKQAGVSVGATFTQVAQRLKELGCVDAIGLDGGGSTMLGVTYPEGSSMQIVNSPSDGGERAVSNAIFLTTELRPTGVPGALRLLPGDAVVLAGARVGFEANTLDTAWYDMGAASGASYTATGAGTVTENGFFTAGSAAGEAVVTASSGALTGQAQITVVDTPTAITVTNEATGGRVQAISLEPGEQLSMTASAVWKGLSLLSQDTCYTWACDPSVGTVSADGTFTAGPDRSSGSLTVTAGGKTVTIPVNVAGHVLTLEDFETQGSFAAGEGAQVEAETTLTHVHNGRQSLRVTYTAPARLSAQLSIPATERYLGLWVYGDGSGNTLTALISTAEGEQVVPLAALNFTGWKHLLAALPQGATTLTGLEVRGSQSGELWLDQLTTANEAVEDFTAPTIDLEVLGTKLTATVSDDIDRTLPSSAVKLFYDGVELTGTWKESTGTLSANLPAPGAQAHRVSVQAVDQSGNVGRASRTVGEGQTGLFADMTDHWAAPYAGYLYDQGVTKGVSAGDILWFQPDSNITRAEFFTMAARWLGLDLESAGEGDLPFADAAEIPAWALPAVRAMAAAGYLQGSLEGDRLYAHPNATITRAEAMTVLGRTQVRGFHEADLAAFSDGGTVPAWAAEYVGSLVGQGVVNGFDDGTVRPFAQMTRGQAAKVLYTLR